MTNTVHSLCGSQLYRPMTNTVHSLCGSQLYRPMTNTVHYLCGSQLYRPMTNTVHYLCRGKVFSSYMQGGLGKNANEAALSAYVLIALLEAGLSTEVGTLSPPQRERVK